MTETDESGIDMSRGSFKLADAETQDTAKLAMILDLMAQRPAVQTLKAWALEQLAPAAGETAVDVGSGTGEDVVRFAKLVGADGRAIGVEPSAGLRAEAARRAAEAIVDRPAEASAESVDRAAEATVEFVDGYAGALALRGGVSGRAAQRAGAATCDWTRPARCRTWPGYCGPAGGSR